MDTPPHEIHTIESGRAGLVVSDAMIQSFRRNDTVSGDLSLPMSVTIRKI